MKLEANIIRFAPRDGYICDVEKERKATAEAIEYDYWFISPGYYLCVHGKKAYVILEYMQKIGCGCADMTYNCKGKEVCKHLIEFMRLKNLPDREITEDMAQLLRAAGWSGTQLTPPNRPGEQRHRPHPPNIQDPAKKSTTKTTERADRRAKYDRMTPEEIIRGMDKEELKKNARRGAPMAIAELERRAAERAVSA